MKFSDIIILISIIFLICTISVAINYTIQRKVKDIKRVYSDMIELSLEGAAEAMNDNLSYENLNMIADGKIEKAGINKEKILERFLGLLSLNFIGIYDINHMSRYLPVFVIMENDGIYINEYNDKERIWTREIPYIIKVEGKAYRFFLNERKYIINGIEKNYLKSDSRIDELKRRAICDTVKRQFLTNQFIVDIPYSDTLLYNDISCKSILTVIKGIPMMGFEKYDLIKTKGIEIKRKAKYVVTENGKYEKNIMNSENRISYDTKYEACMNGYMENILEKGF